MNIDLALYEEDELRADLLACQIVRQCYPDVRSETIRIITRGLDKLIDAIHAELAKRPPKAAR